MASRKRERSPSPDPTASNEQPIIGLIGRGLLILLGRLLLAYGRRTPPVEE